MSNTLGNIIRFTLFGESHGPYIGGTLDGLPGGIKVDLDHIKLALDKRRPSFNIDTSRSEKDEFEIISGMFNGFTTGEPLTILIKNSDVQSSSYDPDIPRPSHADLVAYLHSDGYNDYRGGGHFSGRLTAVIVAFGAIAKDILENKNIKVATHILKCGEVCDSKFHDYEKEIAILENKKLALIDDYDDKLLLQLEEIKKQGDSIGGILESVIIGLPVGLGSPWFHSLEGDISEAVFAIGGVKGIEFGKGFAFSDGLGSELNDNYRYEDGKIITLSNNNGGINGGLSNGNPVIFSLAVKPTPSINKMQKSINLKNKENIDLNINGRHDPAIIRRMPIVISAIVSLLLLDELALSFGRKYLK